MTSQLIASARQGILRYVMGNFPSGLKRATMLSSLIAGLTEHHSERQFVSDLDHALNLSRGGGAGLEFPVRLTKVFWGDLDVFHNDIAVLKNAQCDHDDRRDRDSSDTLPVA